MRLSAHQSLLPGADLFERESRLVDLIRTLEFADEIGAPHLGHAHLADSQRWLPGHGHIDFVSACRALRETKFDGWLALECMPTPGDPLENMRASVAYLRRCWERAEPEKRTLECRGDQLRNTKCQ